MVVCMSRRICIDLYRELARLRPDWHEDDDDKGNIKVVMTGSASDPLEWQPHHQEQGPAGGLAQRFRDPADPLKVVAGAGHVAHGVRRAQPAHHVRGQADARDTDLCRLLHE